MDEELIDESKIGDIVSAIWSGASSHRDADGLWHITTPLLNDYGKPVTFYAKKGEAYVIIDDRGETFGDLQQNRGLDVNAENVHLRLMINSLGVELEEPSCNMWAMAPTEHDFQSACVRLATCIWATFHGYGKPK